MGLEWTVAVMVPLGVAVVLPIMVVWLVVRTIANRDNKNAAVLIKAIESNNTVDADKIAQALGKTRKTPLQLLQARLLRGCISAFIGVGMAIFSIILYNNDSQDSDFVYFTTFISCVTLAVGLAYLLVYFLTRKSVNGAEQA